MQMFLIAKLLIAVYAVNYDEYHNSLKVNKAKRNISFLQQEYFGIRVLSNEIEGLQQLQPITYQESRAEFYFQEQINGSFIGLKNKDFTIFALHKNCTLEFILYKSSSRFEDFKPNCIQLLIDRDQDYLAIIYPDSMIIYRIEQNNFFELKYNFTGIILDIRIIQMYILISKSFEGFDLLNFQGVLILSNFMAKKNILQASIQTNRLLLLFDGGLIIFNSIQVPKISNKIILQECVRFINSHQILIIQTRTKIYEYFWKNLQVNQEISINSEISSISIYQQYLQFISDGYLYHKIIGIDKNDYDLNLINMSKYQTNCTQIIGYQQNNKLILQQDQSFQVVFWHFLPAFIIFKTEESGIFTCKVELYQKSFANPKSSIEVNEIKIYIEVNSYFYDFVAENYIYFSIFLLVSLLSLVFFLRRSNLKIYSNRQRDQVGNLNGEKSQIGINDISINTQVYAEEIKLNEQTQLTENQI
ncbi:unnamed protein product [Paramecium sonneborni]|uniref:Transmembrane protein n=1 Tax=Paramecium sonneborni TaxID=65129 RepID=A0A8S1RAT6_9CILI|nr:unnamed protein product [Paramecium sonneborni]